MKNYTILILCIFCNTNKFHNVHRPLETRSSIQKLVFAYLLFQFRQGVDVVLRILVFGAGVIFSLWIKHDLNCFCKCKYYYARKYIGISLYLQCGVFFILSFIIILLYFYFYVYSPLHQTMKMCEMHLLYHI